MIMKPFLSLAVAMLPGLCAAQEKFELCKTQVKYENRNQVDPRPLSISRVLGRVMVEVGELGISTSDTGPAPGACLALFTEKENQLVATATADNEGFFTFDTVPEGEYRLIVRADPLCVANIPVRVVRSQHGGGRKRKQIVVHMRAADYDTCSYGSYE